MIGNVSPGSTPARKTSAFAVMIPSVTDGVMLRASLLRIPVLVDELGSLGTRKLWLLLLGRLEELTLLGAGLSGGRLSVEFSPFSGESSDCVSGASDPADLAFALDLARREIGSRVTIRGLGRGKGAISMFSNTVTRRRQVEVGLIVVGLVRVDVSI